jgi:hypothetical protein
MKIFTLQRDEDVSGVSGTGAVAEGVVFTDGHVVMRWLTNTASTAFYDSIEDVAAIHGHGGATRVVFNTVKGTRYFRTVTDVLWKYKDGDLYWKNIGLWGNPTEEYTLHAGSVTLEKLEELEELNSGYECDANGNRL